MSWNITESDQRILFSDGNVHFTMVKVPNGNFFIGETPVTQELWEAVMGDNPSYFKDSKLAPVENVSHVDCMNFINVLSGLTGRTFRLPSVDEWMLAAKGGDENNRLLYSWSNDPDEVAWFNDGTHPVRLKKPNSIGLFDMTGNVWEWTADTAPKNRMEIALMKRIYSSLPENPISFYLKGGSHRGIINGLESIKSNYEGGKSDYFGFRLCLSGQ